MSSFPSFTETAAHVRCSLQHQTGPCDKRGQLSSNRAAELPVESAKCTHKTLYGMGRLLANGHRHAYMNPLSQSAWSATVSGRPCETVKCPEMGSS